MDEVITEVKKSVVVAIWKAKIKLVEDLENARSWNVVGWRGALDKLIGKPIDTSQDPALQPKEGGEKNKTEVAPGGGDQYIA